MQNNTTPIFMTPSSFNRCGKNSFEFDRRALAITILDRAGRAIWQKSRDIAPSTIRWDGIDSTGRTVETGDYICKIVYPDSKIAYLPFVFVRAS